VEKILNVGFIYPVPLTEWVSNPVPVDKKQETIRVCMDFCDLNKACLKDKFPTPFIDQILDECVGSEAFSFMDGFLGYNQIQIKPKDQQKMKFICPWGTFAYHKMCSVPKAEPRYRTCYMQRIVSVFYRLVSQVLYKL
jgi:hypothetical protein